MGAPSFAASAQEGIFAPKSLNSLYVGLESRVDYTSTDSITRDGSSSGFHGRYLNVLVNGSFNNRFSFSIRQRLNRFGDMRSDCFGATDWVWLEYALTKKWSIRGGKEIVMIGGYEYDRAPIDIFFASRFWNNIACYQFGVSSTWTSNNRNLNLSFQVCNSPFADLDRSCYAYNLFWNGHIGPLSTLYSVNMIEFSRGHYANLIALGNHLDLYPVRIELDYINRATKHHRYFGRDYSVIGEITYNITPSIRLMAKGGSTRYVDLYDNPGHVDNPFYGGGIEFFPLHGSPDLHIHLTYARLNDNDGDNYNQLNIGVKWRINLYNRN